MKIIGLVAPTLAATAAAVGLVVQALAQTAAPFVPVTDAMIQQPASKDWLSWRRTLDSWGYSPLYQIDRSNVEQRRLVWASPLPDRDNEGTPLVCAGVLDFAGRGDVIEASHAKSGEVLWQHRRELREDIGGSLPFYETDRNLAIYGNLVIAR